MTDIFALAKEKIIISAEIGINHNGNLNLAEKMIDAAAQCGVDAVKFQAFNTGFMYSRLAPGFSHTEKDVFAQVKALEINESWWPGLRERAKKHGLFFSSSAFDVASLEILKRTGLDFIKIASAEIDNLEFIVKHRSLGDIFIISTGMAYLEEIAAVVRFLREKGITKIILLECTSSYPATPEATHLLNIDFLRETFHLPAGFSDHTMGSHHAVAAAARGARFIEKHFTLDKNMIGPDHKISADMAEMKELVRMVREIEISLKTNGKSAVSAHEKEARELGRKSVIAFQRIAKGEIISRNNTIIKRPAKGIKPSEARFLYGKAAAVDIEKDQWITWNMVK